MRILTALKGLTFGASLLAAAGAGAGAASLTGDEVTFDANNGDILRTATVGAGRDLLIGDTEIDFDFGANGDEFRMSVGRGFIGFASPNPDPLRIELRDLNFSGGEALVGFDNLFSIFPGTTFSITPTSITFEMTDTGGDAGVMLSGTFLTSATAVPVPASILLLATAAAGLGVAGRRARSRAA